MSNSGLKWKANRLKGNCNDLSRINPPAWALEWLWDVAFTLFIDLPFQSIRNFMETSFISNSAGADLCSFVQWLATIEKLSAILSAVSLVELLLRGATLNVTEPRLVNANRTFGCILKQGFGHHYLPSKTWQFKKVEHCGSWSDGVYVYAHL